MKKQIGTYATSLPQTVGSGATIEKAKTLFEQLNCHHLPVLDGGQLCGIISLYDLNLSLLTTKGKSTLVKDIMTTSPYVVDPEASVQDICTKMIEQKISSAIIRATNSSPWGIFTTTDALKYISLNG